MREAIRQGLTSFAIFIIAILAVRLAIHLYNSSFTLVPKGERALELGGIAVVAGVFSGLSKFEKR